MTRLTLKAQKRKVTGRKVKRLRKENVLPGNMYGKSVKSQSLQVELKEFQKVFKETGETGLVDLLIESSKSPVLIHNVQVDPATDQPIHADFLKVNLKEKVTARIPVELSGESPAEKQGLGTVVQYIDEVEVVALPTDLPERFEIDLSVLEKVDDSVEIKDLKVDRKQVEFKEEEERILVKVEPPRKEEEEPAPAPAEEAEEGGSAKEGESPQQGEKEAAGEPPAGTQEKEIKEE